MRTLGANGKKALQQNVKQEQRTRHFSSLTLLKVVLVLGCALTGCVSPSGGDRWANSLGQVFVPVPGTRVWFCIWDTRVKDFDAFVQATGHDATAGMYSGDWQQQGDTWRHPGFVQGTEHPVCGVSWEDAQAYCRWLTQRERQAGRLKEGQRYRLPTDAEWSVAVGLGDEAGSTPREKDGKIKDVFPWGTQWPPPAGAGNYAGAEARNGDWPGGWGTIYGYRDGHARTAPVGSFGRNRHGLYDMGGNVWQWCEDQPQDQSDTRVIRGAGWNGSVAEDLFSSHRFYLTPDHRTYTVGFRVVLEK